MAPYRQPEESATTTSVMFKSDAARVVREELYGAIDRVSAMAVMEQF